MLPLDYPSEMVMLLFTSCYENTRELLNPGSNLSSVIYNVLLLLLLMLFNYEIIFCLSISTSYGLLLLVGRLTIVKGTLNVFTGLLPILVSAPPMFLIWLLMKLFLSNCPIVMTDEGTPVNYLTLLIGGGDIGMYVGDYVL